MLSDSLTVEITHKYVTWTKDGIVRRDRSAIVSVVLLFTDYGKG